MMRVKCMAHDSPRRYLVIAKDGFPLEFLASRPIINWIRRVIHGHHVECHDCYERRTNMRVAAMYNGEAPHEH